MIKTDRLILKDHTKENLEKLNSWFNDKELSFYDDEEPFTLQDLDETEQYLVNKLISSGFNANKNIIHIAIHTKEGSLIGYCMIALIDKHNKKCKIGLTIGEKSQWGNGYGKETLQTLIEYCFSFLGMNRITAEIFSMNKTSIRLFEGLGFKKEGTIRKSVLKKSEYVDEYIYGLLYDEWKTT
jgi:RimJ/RimL family protein N-acetyltransferase